MAPSRYSGTGGPGTLEMTRLCTTGCRSARRSPEYIRTAIPRVRGAANSAHSWSVSAEIALWCSLALTLATDISRSRCSGSAMSVPKRLNIEDTLLLPRLIRDSSRTETGTLASSEVSGSSLFLVR